MSFNAGIALGSFAGGLVVNAGGLLATGPAGALFALAAAALALALVRMTARRSVESAAEAARTAATARAEVARALSRRQTLRKRFPVARCSIRSMPADNTASLLMHAFVSKTASNAKKWLTKACNYGEDPYPLETG